MAAQDGYDGQFYLAIALDPLLADPGTVAALDAPRYRYRRILFPALGWVLGLGNPTVIPWALLAVLVASFVGLAHTLGALIRADPGSLPGELVPVALVGAWVSLLLGTPALLCALLFAQALLAYRRSNSLWMWSALALAALTRETSLVLIPAFAIAAMRRSGRREAILAVLATSPALAWNATVLLRLPADDQLGIAGNLVLPFAGIFDKLVVVAHSSLSTRGVFDIVVFLSFLLAIAAALQGSWTERTHAPALAASAFALASLAVIAGPKILVYFVGYSRVFLDLFVLTAIVALGRPRARLAQISLCLQAIAVVAFLLRQLLGAA
jgi:hypothetical protein